MNRNSILPILVLVAMQSFSAFAADRNPSSEPNSFQIKCNFSKVQYLLTVDLDGSQASIDYPAGSTIHAVIVSKNLTTSEELKFKDKYLGWVIATKSNDQAQGLIDFKISPTRENSIFTPTDRRQCELVSATWRCSIRGTPSVTGRGQDLAPLFVTATSRSLAMKKAASACVQRESVNAGASLAKQVCNAAFLRNQGGYCNRKK